LYFGAYPPDAAFEKPKVVEAPVVLDWNIAHPLMQYIRDISLVRIRTGSIVEIPTGGVVLIDSDKGPIAFTTPRSGFVDAVIGFKLLDGSEFNTDWPIKFFSFPLFLYNSLRVLGGARDSTGAEALQPGQPVNIRGDSQSASVEVFGPDGKSRGKVERSTQGVFVFNATNSAGIYHAKWGKDESSAFAVNLFSERESDLATRGLVPAGVSDQDEVEKYQIKIGFNPVAGTRRAAPAIQEWWWVVVLVALLVLLFEWYIYNRRVYI
jgi:hypothetical protein